ncbi:MAG: DUF192 domain-containing protein [Patescibacteria group bacterium]
MRIQNSSNNAILAEQAVVARTLSEKVTGLLGARKPNTIVFRTRWGIHTIGMQFSIDVAVCDGKGRVVAVREDLSPGRLFFWNPRYATVIEFPAGTLQKTKTGKGDTLEFSEMV